jgi:hypothetical protein
VSSKSIEALVFCIKLFNIGDTKVFLLTVDPNFSQILYYTPYFFWNFIFLVLFWTGTDTGGSVRIPAAYCGILGFRPSHGVVSCTGVVPMAQSFDTVGM